MTAAAGARFESAAATHTGLVRAQNEDNFLARPEIGLWAVADGMGGHEAGGLASAVAVAALRNLPAPASAADLLQSSERSMVEANAAIRAIAAARGFDVIGTTVAILLVHSRHFACLWCGDSRVYHCRGGVISQVTRDHSEAQELIDQGVLSVTDAKNWPRRNVITRAIGVFENPEVDLQHGDVEPGDVFVLCSDGLTGHVSDDEIARAVAAADAQQACAALIGLTLERGAQDNVTVVIVRTSPDETAAGVSRPPTNGARE